MDSDFKGYGYRVQLQHDDKLKVLSDGTIQLRVVVRVPAWSTVPLMIEADPLVDGLPSLSVLGETNKNTKALAVTI